jgi:uncharacterized protein YkwD
MIRFFLISMVSAFVLAACAPGPVVDDGTGRAKIYRIAARDADKIPFRMLDSINSLRTAAGLGSLALSSQLNAAASTHSRDMALQNRPWHFGSDGSSPLQRVARTGYIGEFKGETISETYETELETLAAWMETPETRGIIMDSGARDLGFAWHQESNGKIWWTLVTGGPVTGVSVIPQSGPQAQL